MKLQACKTRKIATFQKGGIPLTAVGVTEIVNEAYERKFADQLLPAEQKQQRMPDLVLDYLRHT